MGYYTVVKINKVLSHMNQIELVKVYLHIFIILFHLSSAMKYARKLCYL